MAFTALLDACVLYSAPLRDVLLRLALTDLYRAKWTVDFHAEWAQGGAPGMPGVVWRPPNARTRMCEPDRREAMTAESSDGTLPPTDRT